MSAHPVMAIYSPIRRVPTTAVLCRLAPKSPLADDSAATSGSCRIWLVMSRDGTLRLLAPARDRRDGSEPRHGGVRLAEARWPAPPRPARDRKWGNIAMGPPLESS